MNGKAILRVLLGVTAILLVPLVAMRFTDEVNWTWFDFAAAATLLIVAGLTYEYAASKTRHPRQKMIVAVAVGIVLFIVWVQLAAGII